MDMATTLANPESSGSILLAALIVLPTLGAILLAFVPKEQKAAHRGIGATIAFLVFGLSIPLVTGFDATQAFQPQWAMDLGWVDAIGARFTLGIDGISLWIVVLTTFLTPIILIGAQKAIEHRVREFVISMLVLESAMIGTLVATDLLLFYLFWEMMLIPMYLLIGIWGGKNRLYATVKFVVYTVVGSLLMLVGIIYLYVKTGDTGPASFAFDRVLAVPLSHTEQLWLFAAFALAFCIKVPLFPFHTWLPDAHTEAPTAGSVVLAGILLKMGTYGLLRFAVPLFPEAMGEFSPLILILSVVGIAYGALVAYAQRDVKKLVAYSSVSHLGFVMLGIVAMNYQGLEGAILQMVNHGISTGALFLLVGIVYERRHTREITDYGGIAASMPVFATVFLIVTLSSIGLPGTNGFAGEFLILSGAFKDALPVTSGSWPLLSTIMATVAVTGVVLGAIYMLSMVRRVFFGPITHEVNKNLKDMSLREHLVLQPLIILIFVIGLFPTLFTSQMTASVKPLIDNVRPVVMSVRDPERLEKRFEANNHGASDPTAPRVATSTQE
ncbi:MAG: NADH-quinone oxidoreductase subunit M [Deltaproteobacteria bacterium]|nr:MAG: NADH-quinone oxidoreductase subunit M [Deltaproteobacteria bacterium]